MNFDESSDDSEFIAALQGLMDEIVRESLERLKHIPYPEQYLQMPKIRPAILGSSRNLDWAKRVYQIRRNRNVHLPQGLFGEPAWDILLDLYIHYHEGRMVAIKETSIASDSPASTANRYIKQLEAAGLVQRTDDEEDGRKKWVCLTRAAVIAISKICEDDCLKRDSRKVPFLVKSKKNEEV